MIELELTDQNSKQFEQAVKEEMEKCLKHFERELITIRTGRAHPALVENIPVSCYGGTTTMKIRELASISTPEARLIVVEPWDKAVLLDVEKAIAASELGVTPDNDGNCIRILLPDMSTHRRQELAKILGKKLEDARISVRNIRKEFHNLIRDSQKNKSISEDHERRLNELLQTITNDFIKDCDQMAQKKEKEITVI